MKILSQLHLYPIKSCAGIALREATITKAGLMSEHIYDREWMVVDAQGKSLTQREYPRMALIMPRLKGETMELRAPGMLRLEIPLELPEPDTASTIDARLWYDDRKLIAYDCDELTATWFSQALGVACRLVRFHPHARREVSTHWTGGIEAETLFSDGYPMLIISEASLEDLNRKLVQQGRDALSMNRFRPNIVISGVDAFEEDYAQSINIDGAVVRLAKPCPRCTIPAVDQATGSIGPSPLDILQTYRANALLDGAVTFGMNAVLAEGAGRTLRTGQALEITLAF